MLFAAVAGCGDRIPAPPPPKADVNAPIIAASPYLEAALRDVLPRDVPLVRLAGPGMCPGHFDMRPSQLTAMARCRFLVRFDFQQSFDAKIRDRTGRPLPALSVHLPGGMCEPETYLAACRQLADHCVAAGIIERSAAEQRLGEIAQRMKSLAEAVHRQIDDAGIRGMSVLCSGHQAAFCRWLGLRVAAAFSAGDTAGAVEIDQAVKAGEEAGVRLIIANEPEGRQLADALADRLGARVVVLANFPDPDQQCAFDALVQRNVSALSDGLETRADVVSDKWQ